MYDLIIVWENGEKDVYTYDTYERAMQAGADMATALGKQITWYGVRERR